MVKLTTILLSIFFFSIPIHPLEATSPHENAPWQNTPVLFLLKVGIDTLSDTPSSENPSLPQPGDTLLAKPENPSLPEIEKTSSPESENPSLQTPADIPLHKVTFFSSMEWYDPKNALHLQQLSFPQNPEATHPPKPSPQVSKKKKNSKKRRLQSNTVVETPNVPEANIPPENQRALKTMMLFKTLYDKNNFFDRGPNFEAKIPKKIHQIWFGPKTPPAIFKESQESLKKHHPDWEYKLWTDADIPSLGLQNEKFYNLSENYAEKADLVRYELLDKFGGVYVDVDFVCYKPFDVLTQYGFWAGIESLDCVNRWIMSNAIIGAAPGHPILRHCIDTIQQSWYETSDTFLRVGPAHLSESVVACASSDSDDVIIFPKSFFYSLDFKNGLAALKDKLNYSDIQSQIRPETFAMHFWAGTWWRPELNPKVNPASNTKLNPEVNSEELTT